MVSRSVSVLIKAWVATTAGAKYLFILFQTTHVHNTKVLNFAKFSA